MKKLFLGLALFTLFAVADLNAQFSNLWIADFTVDTLTNADAGEFVFTKKFDYASDITYVVQLEEISGTASCLLTTLQNPTANTAAAAWVVTDTLATATATGTHIIHLTADPEVSGDNPLWGYSIKLRAATTGTGVYRVKAYAIARRRQGY